MHQRKKIKLIGFRFVTRSDHDLALCRVCTRIPIWAPVLFGPDQTKRVFTHVATAPHWCGWWWQLRRLRSTTNYEGGDDSDQPAAAIGVASVGMASARVSSVRERGMCASQNCSPIERATSPDWGVRNISVPRSYVLVGPWKAARHKNGSK